MWFLAVSKRLRCAVAVKVLYFLNQAFLQDAQKPWSLTWWKVMSKGGKTLFRIYRFVAKSTEGNPNFLKLVESSIEEIHFSSVAQAHSVGS